MLGFLDELGKFAGECIDGTLYIAGNTATGSADTLGKGIDATMHLTASVINTASKAVGATIDLTTDVIDTASKIPRLNR